MKHLINETLREADAYLKNFGFTEEQIAPLLVQGEKDLRLQLERTKDILSEEPLDYIAVDQAFHALKGLLFSLGNYAVAEKLMEIRETDDEQKDIQAVMTLLFKEE
jgi:hypothetical protein